MEKLLNQTCIMLNSLYLSYYVLVNKKDSLYIIADITVIELG